MLNHYTLIVETKNTCLREDSQLRLALLAFYVVLLFHLPQKYHSLRYDPQIVPESFTWYLVAPLVLNSPQQKSFLLLTISPLPSPLQALFLALLVLLLLSCHLLSFTNNAISSKLDPRPGPGTSHIARIFSDPQLLSVLSSHCCFQNSKPRTRTRMLMRPHLGLSSSQYFAPPIPSIQSS